MSGLTVTVAQLNRYIKALMEEDKKLQGIFVKGEVADFKRHFQSGHCYFRLQSADASVRAVLFRTHAEDLRFTPENGMAVLVQANVGVYERDGVYQLYVTDMQPDGAGALAVAFEQMKHKLMAEGLFDAAYKKPLPALPARIGVVTSTSGAALQDILHVLKRRYPLARLVLCSATVQGQSAPDSIVQALQAVDRAKCDVVIVGRGGGSAEDLSCFNDERIARCVFAMQTPVVSAIGHETDYTICDFVADLRAPTPSAAAELVAPSVEELQRRIQDQQAYCGRYARRMLQSAWQRFDQLASRRVLQTPEIWLVKNKERLDFLTQALYNKKSMHVQIRQKDLAHRAALLDSLSPLRVLERGFCAAFRQQEPVVSAAQVSPNSALRIQFRDGAVETLVRTIELEDGKSS